MSAAFLAAGCGGLTKTKGRERRDPNAPIPDPDNPGQFIDPITGEPVPPPTAGSGSGGGGNGAAAGSGSTAGNGSGAGNTGAGNNGSAGNAGIGNNGSAGNNVAVPGSGGLTPLPTEPVNPVEILGPETLDGLGDVALIPFPEGELPPGAAPADGVIAGTNLPVVTMMPDMPSGTASAAGACAPNLPTTGFFNVSKGNRRARVAMPDWGRAGYRGGENLPSGGTVVNATRPRGGSRRRSG